MESVHGVDVSWLHRPQKDGASRPRAPSSPAAPPSRDKERLPSPPRPSQIPTRSNSTHENSTPKPIARVNTEPIPAATPAPTSAPTSETAGMPENKENSAARSSRRPAILARSGADRTSNDGTTKTGRRASWISNISSRFSSTSSPLPSPASPQVSRPIVNGSHATSPGPDLERLASPQLSPSLTRGTPTDELQPYVPQRPRESGSSFFSSITKRLAPGAQGNSSSRFENGGVCARRTLNVNPNRARCLLPELDHSKLRRVSFSVDVEIASGPRYRDDEPAVSQAKKAKDKKIKERAEGEALKNPAAATEAKDAGVDKEGSVDNTLAKTDSNVSPDEDHHADEKDPKAMTRKQEKKKKSEEERKERKEKRRKRAEENGTAPIEFRDEADSKDSSRSVSIDKNPAPVPAAKNDRPTTDPVRIYRRCCQLRESPILKRITEQLMAPNCTDPNDSGTVICLNLTGSRLQLADFITLGDWLAIVPVRRLLLEDAEITDEGLRVVLAGLLSSKKPEPTRTRRSMSGEKKSVRERAGVIEKLMLKNNPRITRVGWKHLAVFLNMCRSIKAVDVTMISFPETMPTGRSGQVADQAAAPNTTDAAEIFAKAIAERVAGKKLEELIMSECSMNSSQIQRILEAATTAGIARIGLAGSHLDQEGFSHVLEYLRSGVCEAIDIGSNEIDKDRMKQLAEALTYKTETPFWGLSIAACNLEPSLLKILLPALTKLPLLRFVDFSHNRGLFENDNPEAVQLLRKYIPLLRNLKRIHLMDVGISAKQTIGIAEVLPEGPALAHIGLLENAELSKLVTNTDEASQEEACALYASLMAAVRVSTTIVYIDIDVPAPDNSEVVKALAKQVLAYCLRNMELTPLRAVTHNIEPGTPKPELAEGALTIAYPDVLQHLVGHVDEADENNDTPDDDYIVGSTGVVKALQYCLSEAKAQEMRRSSATIATPTTSSSGTGTPRVPDRDQQAGIDIERSAKAKEMSKSLLGSARKIRGRLQLAIRSGAANGDEMAYRRLLMLDQTLERMIQRFENEFPETRIMSPTQANVGSAESIDSKFYPNSIATSFGNLTADIGIQNDSDEDYEGGQLGLRASRRGSEVSLASRALSQEEGRVLRFGHELRQDIIAQESRSSSPGPATIPSPSPMATFPSPLPTNTTIEPSDAERLAQLKLSLEGLTGGEIKDLVEEHSSMEEILARMGTTIQDLRVLKAQDPQGWEEFVESQLAARRNAERTKEHGL